MIAQVFRQPATRAQVNQMLDVSWDHLHVAVDLERGFLAGGGETHADAAAALLEAGSRQAQIWGASWLPKTRQVRCEALINAHPQLRNGSRDIQQAHVRERVTQLIQTMLRNFTWPVLR